MTSPGLLKYRLPFLCCLLGLNESVNLVKLAVAFGWTNESPFGAIGALTLGLFLIGSVVALSFELDKALRGRLEAMVVVLFLIQTSLICVVSFLYSLSFMPVDRIVMLLGTPVENTRRLLAVAEGMSLNISAIAFWGVLGAIWRSEIDDRKSQLSNLVRLDSSRDSDSGREKKGAS